MKIMKFSKNWNAKLHGNYFTTIRNDRGRSDELGEQFQIVLYDKILGTAELIKKYLGSELKGSNLKELVICMDTGFPYDNSLKFLSRYNVDVDKDYWCLLFFKWIEKESWKK